MSNKLHILCSQCAGIDFSPTDHTRPRRQPQKLYDDLLLVENSSKNGCHLCTMIFYSLTLKAGGTDTWRKQPDGPVKVIWQGGKDDPHLYVTCNDFGGAKFAISDLGNAVKKEHKLALGRLPDSIVQESLGSDQVFAQISVWRDICSRTHEACRQDSEPPLPTRVIDVGSSDKNQDPRLIATAGKYGKYVTLSYRWGTTPTLTTTSKNFSAHMSNIKMEELPCTLRDAVLVTRKLGIQFIWIDSLCIIQDSSEDWAEQAALMARIYQNASITISADSAKDSASGFLGDRDLRAITKCHYEAAGLAVEPDIPHLYTIIDLGGLSQRGWVLQERIFSARIIHWGHLEVGWECQEMQASQRQTQGQNTEATVASWRGSKMRQMILPAGTKAVEESGHATALQRQNQVENLKTGVDQRAVYDAWYDLVEEYSERLLTYPDKDKLVALSGIVGAFYAAHKDILGDIDSYVSGLWKNDMARGLCYGMSSGDWWRQSHGLPLVIKCDPEDPSTFTHRAPSFSWTSLDDTVKMPWKGEIIKHLYEYDIEVVALHKAAVGKDPWGPVKDCWVILRGILFTKDEISKVSRSTHPDPDQRYGDFPARTCFLRLCVSVDENGLYEQMWLVIHPIGNEKHGFRRLGTMSTRGDFSMNCRDLTTVKLV